MRILLVEPQDDIAAAVELMLKAESFNVYTTDLGEDAIDLGKLYDYDAILLELALPDVSGFEVIRALRVAKVPTPILVLSSLNGVEDRVRAFGFGADDFIPKPFHKDELVARIHAVVRRSRGVASNLVTVGPLTVDIGRQTADVSGLSMHLTGKEYRMLELLALRQGMTVSKEMFLNHLYGGMDEPELKIIDVFICKVRAKLRRAGADGLIQTIWGRGYTLAAERKPEAFVSNAKPSEITAQEAVAA